MKGPLKGGFLQVWQRKPGFWPFLEPYLQGIGATTLVLTGMAAKGRRGVEKQRPATVSCGPLIVHRAGLELGKVHVALLGQGLVEGKGFVKCVAGLTLLSNLEVIPHELLVVRVNAVLNDALGALGG